MGERDDETLDPVLELADVEPDALREAEFAQVQNILDTLAGKTILQAEIEETRVVITTSDGNKYFFYGFLGER